MSSEMCKWLFISPENDLLCMLNALIQCPQGGESTNCLLLAGGAYDPDIQLDISEIYPAISGEGVSTGKVCTIVRTVGCNLRCKYCDSIYAYEGGDQVALKDVVAAVLKFGISTVLFTGGEPLLHTETALHFLRAMLENLITTYIETNGSVDIWPFKMLGRIVMDIKTPSSGEHAAFHKANLNYIGPMDEVKFVVATVEDYKYAIQFVEEHSLFKRTPNVFISPVWSEDKRFFQTLAGWLIRDRSPLRLMLQQHKCIWGTGKKGV